MTRKLTLATFFVAVLTVHGSSLIVRAQSDVSGETAHRFHTSLVDALSAGNRVKVAALFRYPMQVRVLGLDSRLVAVKDAAAMVRMYPLFFGPRFRCEIEKRTLVGAGVLSMASGRVIAERAGDTFRITRLTVALEAPSRAKPSTTVMLPSWGKRQLAGRLAHSEADTYLVSARAGDRLNLRLEKFPGQALSITVYNARTNLALEGAATEYARVWNARLPDDGSYRVEIRRRLAYCDPEVTYLLTLAIS